VVPVIYSLLRTKVSAKHLLDERLQAELQAEKHPGGGYG
jgi:hypothetical protein